MAKKGPEKGGFLEKKAISIGKTTRPQTAEVLSFFDALPSTSSSVLKSLTQIQIYGVPIFSQHASAAMFLSHVIKSAPKLETITLSDTDMRDDDLTFMARFIPTTLTALDLSRNKITSVPSSFRNFRKLKSLDLSRNEQLRFVTPHLAQLVATDIDMRECPALIAPSSAVTQAGPKAVRTYFGQTANFWLPHRVTVAVLGHSEAGKTSLVNTLSRFFADSSAMREVELRTVLHANFSPDFVDTKHKKSPSTSSKSASDRLKATVSTGEIPQLQSTVGVANIGWKSPTIDAYSEVMNAFGTSQTSRPDTEYDVLDFAGQLEYITTHRYFLPCIATIYLLVTDLSQNVETQRTRLRHWIKLLQEKIGPQLGQAEIQVGDPVLVPDYGTGIVRYVGSLHWTSGVWAGVELDTVGSGKNDGAAKGVRYFTCEASTGVFCEASRVIYQVQLANSGTKKASVDIQKMPFTAPNATIKLIGTKSDLSPLSAEQLKRATTELINEAITLGVNDMAVVSSKTGAGITDVGYDIMGYAAMAAVSRAPGLPLYVQQVYTAVQNLSAKCSLLSETVLRTVLKALPAYVVSRSLAELAARELFVNSVAVGMLIRQPDSELIWANPAALSQIMALFVSPLSHKLRYFSQVSKPIYGGALIKREEALQRLRTLKEFASMSDADALRVLRGLEQLDLCVPIETSATSPFSVDAFLFPALRPSGELHLLPPHLEGSRLELMRRQSQALADSQSTGSWLGQIRVARTASDPFVVASSGSPVLSLSARAGSASPHSPSPHSISAPPSTAPSPVLPRVPASKAFYAARQFTVDRTICLSECYFRLLLIMRNQLDFSHKIYSNTVLLTQGAEKGLLVLKDDCVIAIAHGPLPHVLMPSIEQNAQLAANRTEVQLTTHVLCPKCAQGIAVYTRLNAMGYCPKGHWEHGNAPAQFDPTLCANNAKWSSNEATLLESGEWKTYGTNLRYSELREEGGERAHEFYRAKDLFYKFTARDPTTQYELKKVVFLHNEDLQEKFAHHFLLMSDTNSSATLPDDVTLTGNDEDVQWRNWVLTRFNDYVLRCPNTSLNLVAGWHGTSEEISLKIGDTNFLEPHELINQKDPGYFGKGIYFTQWPSYSGIYSGQDKCLVFTVSQSYINQIIMGRIYPVTESPNDSINFLGKGCQPGFDSHYAVVKRMNDKSFFPCKPNETPEYDELVVFKKAQILPRYLFYFTTKDAPPTLKQTGSAGGTVRIPATPLAVDEVLQAEKIILWVDDKAEGEHIVLMSRWSKEEPKIAFKALSSTEELRVWLNNRAEKLQARPEGTLRIITNRYRPRDGGPAAAENLIVWIRNQSQFPRIPILIYCSNTSGIQHLLIRPTYATTEAPSCRNFATFGPLDAPDKK